MSWYVLLGRTCDPDDRVPQRVLVPAGTVLYHLTADLVTFGPHEPSIWDQMHDTGCCSGGGAEELPNLAMVLLDGRCDDEVRIDGRTPAVPGTVDHTGVVHLCTDTTGTCPTTSEQAATGTAHTCEGLLATHAGTELYWMEYTRIRFVDQEAAVPHPELPACAQTVLSTALRDRTEAALRTGLPEWGRDFVPDVVRAFVGRDPDRFVRRVDRLLRDGATAGRTPSVEEVLREALAERLTTELSDAWNGFAEEVLESQTREVVRRGLGRLARAVEEEAGRRAAPVGPATATDMLEDLLSGRLTGARDDLVAHDLKELRRHLRPALGQLRQTVLEDVVEALASIYRRLGGESGPATTTVRTPTDAPARP
ncbi:hypothetical protein [Streptomyces sp. NPDC001594]|uniref:hypothetical protein n=1 Tax=Streptomyces sp. NPDC001594 TaxID=3364590 RepID=UPI0036A44A84